MTYISPRFLLFACASLLFLTACDSSDGNDDPVPLNVLTAVDVEADPAVNIDPNSGRPVGNGLYTLFDLDTGSIVLSSSETNLAVREQDSVSTAWDIGFQSTTIIFNGGTSGPGQGTAQLLTEPFSAVTEAPETGYVADGANTSCPAVQTPGGTFPGAPFAICTGSDNGWYNYNPQINLVSPLAGRTIVLTTGEGNFAKVRILSYYQGNPNPPDASVPSRYYTFEYILQPDGTRSFESTTAD
ncbi:MAG: HmuY family protein [Bacteroidota bacterium]